MKRTLSLVLVLIFILVFGLHATGVQEEKKPEKVTLRYWMQTETVINNTSQELIDAYQNENPNIEIIMDRAPHADHVSKIYVAIAGEAGPDIFVFPEREIPRLMQANALAPVALKSFGASSQQELTDQFTSGALDPYFFNKQFYAIPAWTAIYSWAINKDHFNEVGLNPETQYPKTWDDVISAGKKVKVVKDGRMVREPITFPFNMAPAWYVLGYEPILYQYGGTILNEDHTEARLNSPEGVKALQLWYDMVYKHEIVSLERATEKFDTEFANGTISMWFGANWQAPTFIKSNPAIEGHFKIIPFPVVKGGQRAVGTSTWSYLVMAASKQQTDAWKFIAFAMSKAPSWLEKTGFLLPVKGLAESPQAKAMPFSDIWLDDIKFGKPLLIDLHFAEIAQSIVGAIEKSLLTGVEPKKALDESAKEINKIIRGQ